MVPLTDEDIASLWEWDITAHWVRVKLAERIRDAGYIVIPVPEGNQ